MFHLSTDRWYSVCQLGVCGVDKMTQTLQGTRLLKPVPAIGNNHMYVIVVYHFTLL